MKFHRRFVADCGCRDSVLETLAGIVWFFALVMNAPALYIRIVAGAERCQKPRSNRFSAALGLRLLRFSMTGTTFLLPQLSITPVASSGRASGRSWWRAQLASSGACR